MTAVDIPVALAERGTTWRRFRANRFALVALGVLGLLVVAAALAPVLAPHDPLAQDLRHVLDRPSPRHWLGADENGRDVLSRLLYADRTSLLAAAEASVIGVVGGVPFGVVAGYYGGWLDRVIVFVADALMSFPPLLLAICIVGVLGPGLTNAMVAIGIIFAPRFARLTRAVVLAIRHETFIDASRSIGVPSMRIMRRHVFPNALPPLAVQASLAAGVAMLVEASLSFLGLGVQPPDASWGAMLGRSFRFIEQRPTLVIFPGTMIAIAVLALNIVGDALADASQPSDDR